MSNPRKPQAQRLALVHAHKLGSELIRTGGDPARTRVEIEAGGWRVVVEVLPACELPGDLTACETDVVGLLRGRRGPLTTTQVLDTLDRAGLIHGESTVKSALARLTHRGVLTNSRLAPKGYLLAERYRPSAEAADAS